MGSFVLRVAFAGFALLVATLIVPGFSFVRIDTPLEWAGMVFAVSMTFGLVSVFIKQVVVILLLPLFSALRVLEKDGATRPVVLIVSLFDIVINAFSLWITPAISRHISHWGLKIDHFWWTAIWAAIVVSVLGQLLWHVSRSARR